MPSSSYKIRKILTSLPPNFHRIGGKSNFESHFNKEQDFIYHEHADYIEIENTSELDSFIFHIPRKKILNHDHPFFLQSLIVKSLKRMQKSNQRFYLMTTIIIAIAVLTVAVMIPAIIFTPSLFFFLLVPPLFAAFAYGFERLYNNSDKSRNKGAFFMLSSGTLIGLTIGLGIFLSGLLTAGALPAGLLLGTAIGLLVSSSIALAIHLYTKNYNPPVVLDNVTLSNIEVTELNTLRFKPQSQSDHNIASKLDNNNIYNDFFTKENTSIVPKIRSKTTQSLPSFHNLYSKGQSNYSFHKPVDDDSYYNRKKSDSDHSFGFNDWTSNYYIGSD